MNGNEVRPMATGQLMVHSDELDGLEFRLRVLAGVEGLKSTTRQAALRAATRLRDLSVVMQRDVECRHDESTGSLRCPWWEAADLVRELGVRPKPAEG